MSHHTRIRSLTKLPQVVRNNQAHQSNVPSGYCHQLYNEIIIIGKCATTVLYKRLWQSGDTKTWIRPDLIDPGKTLLKRQKVRDRVTVVDLICPIQGFSMALKYWLNTTWWILHILTYKIKRFVLIGQFPIYYCFVGNACSMQHTWIIFTQQKSLIQITKKVLQSILTIKTTHSANLFLQDVFAKNNLCMDDTLVGPYERQI